MPTEPNAEFLADPEVPRIRFSGKDWPIPHLAPAQLRIVMPLLLPMVTGARKIDVATISTQDIDDLCTIVHHAILRAHNMPRAEFDGMPTDLFELTAAIAVVSKQSGMLRPAAPGETPSGEALRTSPTGAV